MKKRYNISINIDVMEKAQTHIDNISAYIEKCLINANAHHEQKQRIKAQAQEHRLNEEDTKKLQSILDVDWISE